MIQKELEKAGFERSYDDTCTPEGVWEYYQEFSEPDEGGNFEYEMINYCQDIDNPEAWLFDASVRRDITKPANSILLVNPDLDTCRIAMKILGFTKEL